MQAYIIRSVNTNKMIEAHDDASKVHAERMVKVHNNLYPHDKWYLSTEIV